MSWWQLEEESLNILKTVPNMTKCKKETSNNCLMEIKSPTYKCKHNLFLDSNIYIMIFFLYFSPWMYM